ncbi:N-acetylmuramoyl-L-alanine amidase [Bacillus sp. DNRA2]|uniref:N-acetylmuramoyl-L-alanine amidase n=1 Tax=Bacillus sp. DNRA2 TaxID=2723053 RepID=UPI00145EFA1A|nr:N-acetylmuramoyl-L-alanine amidase [Bacillus sp. DNRA2]NMD68797.1 N-acetylmuramoyl-L-alanine amidase [Bacillus sp. DNRA2]
MKHNNKLVALLFVVIALLLSFKLPFTTSAQTISSQTTFGYLDNPGSGATLKGTHNIHGWFLDGSGVASIEVLIDGVVAGQAIYGDARQDVQAAYPQYNNGNAGFHFALDTTKFADGNHTITIKETGQNGQVTTLPNCNITIKNDNVFGYLDGPVAGTTLNGTYNVHGWFLDGNGISTIEVLVDGKVVGQATYGDARPDIKTAFPQFNNSNAGFHFPLDTTKFSDGSHTISIRENGLNGRITNLPTFSINIKNDNAFGYLDNPISGSTLKGTHNVHGWFLDGTGVSTIEVLVDGAVVGQATYGDARSDIKNAFPQYNNDNAGFHYALDTTKLSDGKHTISIREIGQNGRTITLPTISINIKNDNAFGYLDNPVSGSTLKGTHNVHGWFLDENGVANIDVLIDGKVVGQAIYGDARSDIKSAFPQYNNSYAGFHFALDTNKFSDGQHTLTIKATGLNGRTTTLPSSTISIQNASAKKIGYIDNPASGTTLKGNHNIHGWFLDESDVASIEVLVDGAVVGQAIYGDERTDVYKAYSQYNNKNAGFHFSLDTTKFSDGQHTVSIRETGKNGRVVTLPNNTITIKNANAFGYLDNPVSGSKLRGIHNISGWFLDENGVANIEVLVDGKVVGQATYGDNRPDIQNAFPQFNNANAGFHYELDTTLFTEGQHTITIRETGTGGLVTTLDTITVTFKQKISVFLDPGHGGSDPGAGAGGVREADLNFSVAQKVQALLVERGYTVYMSRYANTTVGLLDRSQMANDLKADIFVSIHTNSTSGGGETSANGIESYYYQYFPEYPSKINGDMHNDPERVSNSISLTKIIQENLIEYTGANNRGTHGETFSVVRESAMPATLIEMGFINNSAERQKLVANDYQNAIARAIADGIVEYTNSL